MAAYVKVRGKPRDEGREQICFRGKNVPRKRSIQKAEDTGGLGSVAVIVGLYRGVAKSREKATGEKKIEKISYAGDLKFCCAATEGRGRRIFPS